MAQHNARHLYVTWRLAAKVATTWVGEIAVSGLRIAATGGETKAGSAGTFDLASFLVNDANATATTAHLNKVQAWAGDSGADLYNVTDGDQDGIAEAVWTYFDAVKGNTGADYTLQDIRLYALSDAGLAVTPPVIYTPTVAISGTAGGYLPPEVALVISTQTAAMGRRGRGRWYRGPLTNGIATSSGLVSGSYKTTEGNAAGAFISAIRAIGGVGSGHYTPIVWHRGSTQGAVINGVRIGDELDTQQRRRRQRAEQYTSFTVT